MTKDQECNLDRHTILTLKTNFKNCPYCGIELQ